MPFDEKSLEANSPVITLLREAHGRIEQGFVQHKLKVNSSPPKYCALGAVIDHECWWAVEITPAQIKAFQYFQTAVGCLPLHNPLGQYHYTYGIAAYNNTHTQQEVLNAFDKAIELAVADALVAA